jgi:hypothetical protein
VVTCAETGQPAADDNDVFHDLLSTFKRVCLGSKPSALLSAVHPWWEPPQRGAKVQMFSPARDSRDKRCVKAGKYILEAWTLRTRLHMDFTGFLHCPIAIPIAQDRRSCNGGAIALNRSLD